MIKVDCMVQQDGGEYEAFQQEFVQVPRIGERVKLTGPEFGNEHDHTAWKSRSTGLINGEQTFVVWDVVWDGSDGGVEIYLALEAVEQTFVLWCACNKTDRETFGTKIEDGVATCVNCGRKQR